MESMVLVDCSWGGSQQATWRVHGLGRKLMGLEKIQDSSVWQWWFLRQTNGRTVQGKSVGRKDLQAFCTLWGYWSICSDLILPLWKKHVTLYLVPPGYKFCYVLNDWTDPEAKSAVFIWREANWSTGNIHSPEFYSVCRYRTSDKKEKRVKINSKCPWPPSSCYLF